MTLPKLPEPASYDTQMRQDCYTADQMLAFQRETVEACAKVCEAQEEYGPRNETIWDCADAIRSMK